jgi:hypothetical protein
MSTVTVASKLQSGLILQLWKMEPHREPAAGGTTREVKRAVKLGTAVTVAGCATYRGVGDPAPKCQIIGGYALTPGVDEDFFAEWLKQNADADVVKNRLIFAHEKPDHATGMAKEQAALKSGAEPIAVGAPGEKIRDPRVAKAGIRGLVTADVK